MLEVVFDCLFLCQEETSDSDSHTLPAKLKHASHKCSGKKDFDKTSEITHSKSSIDKLSPHVLSTSSPTHCDVTKSTSELPAQSAISSGETDKQYGMDQSKFCEVLQKVYMLLKRSLLL